MFDMVISSGIRILAARSILLLNPLHTIPLPLQILLPQTNFIITPADR